MIVALSILTAYLFYLALCAAVEEIVERRAQRRAIRRRLGIAGRRTR